MRRWYALRRGATFAVELLTIREAGIRQESGWELGARPFALKSEADHYAMKWEQLGSPLP